MSPEDPMSPPDSRPERHPPGTRDSQGRLLCTAKRKNDRGPCDQPQITGMDKCRIHVGMTVDQARKTVQESIGLLAAKALGIAWEMINDPATPPAVRATLLRDALDRAGHAGRQVVEHRAPDLSSAEARAAASSELADEVARKRAEHEAREAG